MTRTMKRTYPLGVSVGDGGDYANRIDKLRIVREPEFGDDMPWQLDGVVYGPDGVTNYTAAVLNFDSHADAVAAVPGFLAMLLRNGVDVSAVAP